MPQVSADVPVPVPPAAARARLLGRQLRAHLAKVVRAAEGPA